MTLVSVLTLWAWMLQGGAPAAPPPAPVVVVFETEAGTFEAAIDVAHAPVTAANFLKYVDAGAYADGYFHRTVRPDTEIGRASCRERV